MSGSISSVSLLLLFLFFKSSLITTPPDSTGLKIMTKRETSLHRNSLGMHERCPSVHMHPEWEGCGPQVEGGRGGGGYECRIVEEE